MTEQLLISLFAGLGIAVCSGTLGIFVISQRLAFFSDAVSHAALLGISVSIVLSLPVNVSFVITGLIFAAFLTYLLSYSSLNSDTLIGILAHSFLALSLLALSLFSDKKIDLEHYLFGDLNYVNIQELFWVALCLGLNAIFVYRNWHQLILMTLHEELAQVEGINTQRLRLQLTLLLALLVTVSIQLVGALLVSALLIIPAASAQAWSRSPKQSLFSAIVIASIAVVCGIIFAKHFFAPSGPSIVFFATLAFCVSQLTKRKVA